MSKKGVQPMEAIVVAILSALAGFLVWIAQRYFERRSTERLRKEKLYRTLLAASIELVATGDGAPFVIESQRAWLYAADEVLEAINDYLKAFVLYANINKRGGDSTESWAAVKDAEGRLRLSIRKDLRHSTKIEAAWVKEQWELVSARPERIRQYLKRDSGTSEEHDNV